MPSGVHHSTFGLTNAEFEKVRAKLPALFDYDDTFYREIEKRADVEVVGSRDIRVPLELRPGGKFGHFEPDHGDLGLGSGPYIDKALVPMAYTKYAIQWSTKADWATDNKRKSAVQYFKHILAKGMASYRRHIDTLCVGDGTGVLGTIGSVTINTPVGFDTIVLDSDGHRARLLRYGQDISVYTSNLATQRTGGGTAERAISYYDSTTNTIRIPTGLNTPAAPTAGDKIVVAGLSATPPVSILGIKYHHAATGSWLGLDRSTNPEIKGNEVAAAGPLAISHFRLALNKLGDRVGEMSTSGTRRRLQAWTHPAQIAAYEELGQAVTVLNRDASTNRPGLDMLFNEENFRIAGIPIRTHWAWDRTRIDIIDMDAWGRAVMKEPDFYEVEGRRIFELRGATGGVATSQIFYITGAFNLFMENPISGAFVTGLTVPTGY